MGSPSPRLRTLLATPGSGVFAGELVHEVHQGADPGELDGVVEGDADAADAAVAFEADHAALLRFGDELGFERLGREAEHDVHHAAARALDGAAVEAGAGVDGAVEELRLLLVPALDLREAADLLDPREHVADEVDAERRGRVVERLVLGVDAVLEDLREVLAAALEELVPGDADDDAARADVLLGAGIDEREGADVERAPEEVARHVADERGGAGVGEGGLRREVPLDAVDGLV